MGNSAPDNKRKYVLPEGIPLYQAVSNIEALRADYEKYITRRNYKSLQKVIDQVDLERIEPDAGDMLARFIMNVSKINFALPSIVVLIITLLPLVIAAFEHNFINPGLELDALHDTGFWNMLVIALPALILIYTMYFGRLHHTLIELVLTKVFPLGKNEWNEFVGKANALYIKRLFVLFPYFIALTITMIGSKFYLFNNSLRWHSISLIKHQTFAGWFHIPLIFLFFYMVSLIVTRITITYFVLKLFFDRFEPSIQPLHPDMCGGLSPLGMLSMKLNIGTFIMGIVCAIGIISNMLDYNLCLLHPLNIAIVCGFIIGASIAFFMPLYAAHNRMLESKYFTLHHLNEKIESLNKILIQNIDGNDAMDPSTFEHMKKVRELYDLAAKMPVYPFNAKTVSSFIGSVGIPLLLIVAERVIWSVMK